MNDKLYDEIKNLNLHDVANGFVGNSAANGGSGICLDVCLNELATILMC